MIESLGGAVRIARAYLSNYGFFATVKMLAKLALPRRAYYAAFAGECIVSDGWITMGRCKHYAVGERDVVIGPIETQLDWRGMGIAHAILARATRVWLARGAPYVYIDTTHDNLASRRTIAKAGFVPHQA